MIIFLLTLTLVLATGSFDATLEDGSTITGTLRDWNDQSVTLAIEDEQRTIPTEQVASLQRCGGATARSLVPSVWLALRDGSHLEGTQFAASGGTATLDWQSDSQLTIPNERIRFVRLQKATRALDEQWEEMLAGEHRGDIIVIRRSKTSLDYLEGVIRAVTPAHVLFEFDDEEIEVKLSKLEGLIYFGGREADKPGAPQMKLALGGGNLVNANNARLTPAGLRIVTRGGFEFQIDPKYLERADFTSGRITYVSDLVIAQQTITPAIGSQQISESLSRFLYAPRMDRDFEGSVLALTFPSTNETRQYAKGMALHSRTKLTYRLREEYQRLRGIVGLAPLDAGGGSVRLEIALDGKPLFEQPILRSGDPVPIDIEINGGKLLTILVDYGDDGDTGDRVHLCNLRATK